MWEMGNEQTSARKLGGNQPKCLTLNCIRNVGDATMMCLRFPYGGIALLAPGIHKGPVVFAEQMTCNRFLVETNM